MTKDEFMPVLGIGVMVAFLFIILKKYGEAEALKGNVVEIPEEA